MHSYWASTSVYICHTNWGSLIVIIVVADYTVHQLNFNCKVKFALCLTNEVLCHEDVWGSGCVGPCFLDLNTSWR
jgi:hypothetical protein